MFLENFKRELLKEDNPYILLEAENEMPKNVQLLLAHFVYSEPFVYKLFGRNHTVWVKTPSIETAGVTIKLGKIYFYYNPGFIEKLSESELNFLLQHELYHITRSHSGDGARGARLTKGNKELHKFANIAMDSIINEDLIADGGFGGRAMSMIEGGWVLNKKPASPKVNCIEETFQNDDKDKYTDSRATEKVYKWMVDRKENLPPPEEPEDGDGPPPPPQPPQPYEPREGDIIKNKKTGEYGRITSIDSNGKLNVGIISKDEARILAKGNISTTRFIKKSGKGPGDSVRALSIDKSKTVKQEPMDIPETGKRVPQQLNRNVVKYFE